MHEFKLTFEDAKRRDARILELSFYDVTKGLLPVDIDADNMVAVQKRAFEQFNIFKKQIQNGEYTIIQLEDDVVARNAPIQKPTEKHSFDKLNQFADDFKETDVGEVRAGYENLLGAIFGTDKATSLFFKDFKHPEPPPEDDQDEQEGC